MVEKARLRLGSAANALLAVEDGQALSFSDESFDAVVCSLGLMFFPDPRRGLAEFRRVLHTGGRGAVSVVYSAETVPQHSRINIAIIRAARAVVSGGRRKLEYFRSVTQRN